MWETEMKKSFEEKIKDKNWWDISWWQFSGSE